MTTRLAGDFSLDNVTANLRRLERVVAEGGKKVFWADSPDAPEEEPEEGYAEPYLTLFDEGGWPDDFEDEDPNFVYLNEGDLDEVLEKDEVADALATYQQVRQQIKDTRLGRQFYRLPSVAGKSREKGPSKGQGGKGTSKQGKSGAGKSFSGSTPRKVHIEELKLRTRRKACGQVGHWARECRQRSSVTGSASAFSSSAAPSSQRTSFYWWAGNDPSSSSTAFLTGVEPEGSAKECSQGPNSVLSSFIGVALEDHQGLVDTAAQEGLVGKNALLKYLDALRPLGLRGIWVDKPASARGIGFLELWKSQS